jgi:carbamate kinase
MKIVIALGGNALGNSPQEQLSLVKNTAKPLVDLIEEGHQLVIAHGNGPQVGMINLAMEVSNQKANTPIMPFAECGAMSQGYIGYHLQNAIREEMNSRGIEKEVVTVVTQVVVDENDPGFSHPTKPIGGFHTLEEANEMEKSKGYIMVEDSGRGYRRVVASPKPVDVVEKNVVKALVNDGVIVITVGGGGIPVVKTEHGYRGVDAVIDKDFASAKIAEILHADYLFILTAVEKALDVITVAQTRQYISENHFAPGSMLPKVQAAIDFIEHNPQGTAIIAALEKAKDAISGLSGTKIVR